MPKPTGPTNPILKQVIADLKAGGYKYKVPFVLAAAEMMGRPARRKVEVNLSKVERYTGKDDTVLVPGKVLGDGVLTKAVTIAATSFSATAVEKIEKSGGKIISMAELIEKHPKGTGVKILC